MRSACFHRVCRHSLKITRHHPRTSSACHRTFTSTFSPAAGQNKESWASRNGPRGPRVAVLGGGITGLSTTWNLLQNVPGAQITIYEASDRLGGWIDSEKIPVKGGEVLFEWGPRNLRPDLNGPGYNTVNMIQRLNLTDSMVPVSLTSPAATNRFIYYPDHLVRMPGPSPRFLDLWNSLLSLFKEPIFSGAVGALLAEPWIKPRPPDLEDESVGDFVLRRFGKTAADNLVSGIFHGIYAGDIYNLSVRTLLPRLWYLETRDPEGSGVLAEFAELRGTSRWPVTHPTPEYVNLLVNRTSERVEPSIWSEVARQSSYTFENGLSQLVKSLEDVLRQKDAEIRLNTKVTSLKFDKGSSQVTVSAPGAHSSKNYDYVVSSLSPELLRQSAPTVSSSPFKEACEKANDATTVMVVNLYYENPDLIPEHLRGFGYLLPRSVPIDQNPERALGVIFGSESSGYRGPRLRPKLPPPRNKGACKGDPVSVDFDDLELDTKSQKSIFEDKEKMIKSLNDSILKLDNRIIPIGQDTALGTKLTVMLGGHWWDGWSDTDIPTPEVAIIMSQTLLARHLNITDEPEVARARLAKNAIPQYRVGYRKTMHTIHQGLMAQYEGRVKVAGPWWQGGVGINDCVMKAYETSRCIELEYNEKTGLEQYGKKEEWYLLNLKTKALTPDDEH